MASEDVERRSSAEFLSPAMEQAACHPGMPIRIHGLIDACHLNGLEGVCERWDEESGRWIVRLHSGAFKKLRPANCGVEKLLATFSAELPEETRPEVASAKTLSSNTSDIVARMVLRASCVAHLSMALAEMVHPVHHHEHFYEPLMDCILPLYGLKASAQTEAKHLDSLTFVAGISFVHAGEILHGDGIVKSLLHSTLPHCPHALNLGLFFLSGSSAWLVRQPLPYVEDEDEKGEKQEEHDDDDATSDEAGSTEQDSQLDTFEGFIEESECTASSADPYLDACKANDEAAIGDGCKR